MKTLLFSIIVIFFVTTLFVSFILDREETERLRKPARFWSRLWLPPLLAFFILLPVIFGTLIYFLFIKGTSFYFDRFLSFQDNSTIFTASLWIVLSLFLCQYLFHPLFKEIIYILFRKHQEHIFVLTQILFDSFVIYLIMHLVPGVTVNGYGIAFILSFGLFILNSFLEWGSFLISKRSGKGKIKQKA